MKFSFTVNNYIDKSLLGVFTEDYGLAYTTWSKVLITNGKDYFDLCSIHVDSYIYAERLETLLCKPNGELDFPVTVMRKDYHTKTLDIFVDDETYAKLLVEVNL
jgi:hypothetical protein